MSAATCDRIFTEAVLWRGLSAQVTPPGALASCHPGRGPHGPCTEAAGPGTRGLPSGKCWTPPSLLASHPPASQTRGRPEKPRQPAGGRVRPPGLAVHTQPLMPDVGASQWPSCAHAFRSRGRWRRHGEVRDLPGHTDEQGSCRVAPRPRCPHLEGGVLCRGHIREGEPRPRVTHGGAGSASAYTLLTLLCVRTG